jgi:hypothetical protein
MKQQINDFFQNSEYNIIEPEFPILTDIYEEELCDVSDTVFIKSMK